MRISDSVANYILQMLNDENGIAEQGTHGELLEKGGLYAELYKAQFSIYEAPAN